MRGGGLTTNKKVFVIISMISLLILVVRLVQVYKLSSSSSSIMGFTSESLSKMKRIDDCDKNSNTSSIRSVGLLGCQVITEDNPDEEEEEEQKKDDSVDNDDEEQTKTKKDDSFFVIERATNQTTPPLQEQQKWRYYNNSSGEDNKKQITIISETTTEQQERTNSSMSHHHEEDVAVSSVANHSTSTASSSSMLLQSNSSNNNISSSSSSSSFVQWACEWKLPPTNLTECYELFTRHLVRGKHRWYFLGDSTMRYLFNELKNAVVSSSSSSSSSSNAATNNTIDGTRTTNPMMSPAPAAPPLWRKVNQVKRASNKCNAIEYFGFERATNWTLPNRSLGEGPSKDDSLFCPEAQIANLRMEIDYNNNNTDVKKTSPSSEFPTSYSSTKFQFELLCVEFSLDVELPTNLTRTTQETVAMYLERENNNQGQGRQQHLHDTVCVVNTGIHDTRLLTTKGMSIELYVMNTERYLRLIHPHCGTLIWLGIAAVSDSNKYPQKNKDLVLMNDGVNRILDQYNKNNKQKIMEEGGQSFRPILRMDVWNKALRTPHMDHVHLSIPDYYQPLASLIAQFLQPVLLPP